MSKISRHTFLHDIKSHIFPYTFWLLAAFFYFFQYVLRVSTGVITDDLMRDYAITATSIGSVMGVASIFYVIFQIPAGTLLDSFGIRRPLTFAVLLASLGVILFAHAPSLEVLYLARALIGIGSAFAFVSASKIISVYFVKERLPFMISLTIFTGSLGGIVGTGPLAAAVRDYGWRPSLESVGFLGLLLTVMIFVIGRIQKRRERASKDAKVIKTSLFEGLRFSLTNKQIWLVAIWGFCIYMPNCVFADSWGVPYIMKALAISKKEAADYVSWIYVGILVGSLSYGWLASVYPNYRVIFLTSSFVLCILFFLVIWQIDLISPYLRPLFFMIGAVNSVQLLMFPAATRHAPLKMTGAVVGFVNTFTMASGAIFQKAVGIGLDFLWDGTLCSGIPDYSLRCYQMPLSVIIILLCLATLFAALLKEKK